MTEAALGMSSETSGPEMGDPKEYFSTQELEQIKAQALAFWDDSTRLSTDFFTMVDAFERAWRSQLPASIKAIMDQYPDRASLCPPDIYWNTKSVRADIQRILWNDKPWAKLSLYGIPNFQSEQVEKAETMLQMLLDLQSDGAGYPAEAETAVHQAIYAGAGCIFTSWETQYARMPHWDGTGWRLGKDGLFDFETRATYSLPKMNSIDIRNVRIDPMVDKGSAIRMVGHNYLARRHDLLAKMADKRSCFKFNREDLDKQSFSMEHYFESKNATQVEKDRMSKESTHGDDRHEIIRVSGLFRFAQPNGSYIARDIVCYIADRELIVGAHPNNLPINSWEMYKFPMIDREVSRFFTMGLPEPMMDTWLELFVKKNQSLDATSWNTYGMFAADKNAFSEVPDTITLEPGKVITLDLMACGLPSVDAALAPLRRQPLNTEPFAEAQVLGAELQKGFFKSDYSQPSTPSGTETATGVAALVSGTTKVMTMMCASLASTCFAPTYRNMLVLWSFFNAGSQLTVWDKKGRPLNVIGHELMMPWIVSIDVVNAIERETMTRRIVEAMPMLSTNPRIDQDELTKEVLSALKLSPKLHIPDGLLDHVVLRENMALAAGVAQPVSPFDDDEGHILRHLDFQQTEPAAINELFDDHLAEHQENLQRKTAGLGNTKDTGGITSAANPTSAGKYRTGTGFGLKGANRR